MNKFKEGNKVIYNRNGKPKVCFILKAIEGSTTYLVAAEGFKRWCEESELQLADDRV